MKKSNLDSPIYIFDVKPLEEYEFELDGEPIRIIVFEAVEEYDIIKIFTENYLLGVKAEYVWIHHKYSGYNVVEQGLSSMKLNGENVVCDILTIVADNGKKRIFFDISDFYNRIEDLIKLHSQS
jgi:hypothetical protein